jgi:hypothetical protein
MTALEAVEIAESILHVSRKSGALRTSNAEKVGRAIRTACAHWLRTCDRVVTPELRGAPAWTEAEMNVLRLGKALGQVVRKRGVWAGKGPVMDAAAGVIASAAYGRGRQTFAQVLGEHGGGSYGAELAALLDDADVSMRGHAVKALLAAGHGEHAAAVRPLAEDRTQAARTWVQNAARRYLQRFDHEVPSQERSTRRGLTTRDARQARA